MLCYNQLGGGGVRQNTTVLYPSLSYYMFPRYYLIIYIYILGIT